MAEYFKSQYLSQPYSMPANETSLSCVSMSTLFRRFDSKLNVHFLIISEESVAISSVIQVHCMKLNVMDHTLELQTCS